jgi:hypothetical protein
VIFPEQVGSRFAIYSETLSPYSTASELAYGTGTASLGIQYVARILHARRPEFPWKMVMILRLS